jgi:hypothetical protein
MKKDLDYLCIILKCFLNLIVYQHCKINIDQPTKNIQNYNDIIILGKKNMLIP